VTNDQNKNTTASCRFHVGTSGYAYAEWTDVGFYPAGTRSKDMLFHYSGQFFVTELNYTWYQMPKEDTIRRQLTQVPEGFLFAAKLTRTLTHEIEAKTWRVDARSYRNGIAPLVQTGRLAAILIQLPPSFGRTPPNRTYLAELLDELEGLPLAVEFRHRSWANDRVFEELSRRDVTLVSVDEPELPGLFPSLDAVTNPDLLYIRFHGRNTSGWRSGNLQKQFDYSYPEEELTHWIRKYIQPMSAKAKKGVIFFNNHVKAQAVENALQMKTLLSQCGLKTA
jgi:uncharacterized protein YecE (DUF72 family)